MVDRVTFIMHCFESKKNLTYQLGNSTIRGACECITTAAKRSVGEDGAAAQVQIHSSLVCGGWRGEESQEPDCFLHLLRSTGLPRRPKYYPRYVPYHIYFRLRSFISSWRRNVSHMTADVHLITCVRDQMLELGQFGNLPSSGSH